MLLTAEEIAELLGVSLTTINTKFNRTKDNAKKKGYLLSKVGKGKKAKYTLELLGGISERAKIIFDENGEDINLNTECLRLTTWQFNILLGTILTPMKVFRGTEDEFLKYLGLTVHKRNAEKLREAIDYMVNQEYIWANYDEDVVIVSIRRKFEKQLKLTSDLANKSFNIAAKYSIREWQNVLKVWLAIQLLNIAPDTRMTSKQICGLTNIKTQDTVNKCIRALESENVLKTQKLYFEGNCIGRAINVNAFTK